MEQNQLDAFRKMLISQREEMLQLNEASKEASGTVTLDQSAVGRLSRMDALQAQQMAQATNRRRQLHVRQIDAALRRMEEGHYGYCLQCEEEIAIARLNFDPASTRCMGCMDS